MVAGRRVVFLVLSFALVLGAGFSVFLFYTSSSSVDIGLVTRGPAVEAVYATATVEPVRWAAIAPIKTGKIVEVPVNEGYRVGRGVPLARMDDSDLLAQLAEAESSVRFGLIEMSRTEALLRSKTISQDRYDSVKADLEQAQARQKSLEEQIEQLKLRSPIEGQILWRNVEPGEVKQAGEVVFWVGEPKPLRLEAEVDEQDIPRVRPGQRVVISADAFPGKALFGEVTRITPKGNPENKSYRVYMEIPDDSPLMIGMTVETNTIVSYHKDALLVPPSAIVADAVWVLGPEKKSHAVLRKVPVRVGIRGEQRVEVSGILKPGDRVVLSPSSFLREGQTVRVRGVVSLPDSDQVALEAENVGEGELKADGTMAGCKSGCAGCSQPPQPTDDPYTRMRKEWLGTKKTCYPEVKTLKQPVAPGVSAVKASPDLSGNGGSIPEK